MRRRRHDHGLPRGFTLIEIMVALVFLSVVAISLGTAAQQATRTLRRSRLELRAALFLDAEVERLRILDYDSLVDGVRTRGEGTATWNVTDSTTFRRVLLETRYGSPAAGLVVDSVTLFRTRP
jgi:prepilin-type N-terminal cleavage/methylation domain-containing protein